MADREFPESGGRAGVCRKAAASAWIAPAFLAAILAFPVTDTDLWWHLATGRWIWEHGMVPRLDPFAAAGTSVPWVDVHWLFQLMVYWIWNAAGLPGIVAFRIFGWAAVLWVFRRGLAPAGTWDWRVNLLLTIVLLYPIRYSLPERPLILSMLLLAGMLVILENWRRGWTTDQKIPWRRLWLLLPLQVALANVQGISALGPAVVFAYTLGWCIHVRPGWIWVLAALSTPAGLYLCGAANPYGWAALVTPFRHLGRLLGWEGDDYREHVTENLPAWLLPRSGEWVLPALVAATLLTIWLVFRRRTPWPHRFLLLGASFLAWTASRNIPILMVLVVPLAACAWSEQPLIRFRAVSYVRPGPVLLGVALALGLHQISLSRGVNWSIPAPFRQPTPETLDALAQLPVPVRVLCPLEQGGYLQWTAWPRVSPQGDGRLILRTPAWFHDYLDAWRSPEGFSHWLASHRTDAVLVPGIVFPDYRPLASVLQQDRRWSLIHADASNLLFVRKELVGEGIDLGRHGTMDSLATEERARWKTPALAKEAEVRLRILLFSL